MEILTLNTGVELPALGFDEMAAIGGLEISRRGGPEPEAVTLETFGREIPEA